MNVDTGELRRLLGNEVPNGFHRVPDEEKEAAERLLGDRDSVFVAESNPFRKDMKKLVKHRKKISKQSKVRNRKK